MRRRDLLTTAGMVLVASAAGLRTGVAASDRIRVGIIGTGIRGQQLLDFLLASPEFEVSALCDTLPFRLDEAVAMTRAAATKNRPETYNDHRRLLDRAPVDAVIVATPFYHHAEAALDALDAGKHVYCEKTMTRGVVDTRRVLQAARESDRIFQAGFQFGTSPQYTAALELIRDGELGEIVAVDCQWNRNGDWRRPVPDPRYEREINWRMYREYSSGLAAELSAHQMEFCNRFLPGGVEHISGVGGIDYWKDGRETYDNIALAVRYRDGVTATFRSLTANSLGGYRIRVRGNRGTIELDFGGAWFSPEVVNDAPEQGVDLVSGASVAGAQDGYRLADGTYRYPIDAPPVDATAHAIQLFATAIRDNRQPASNAETGAVVAVMVQMALDAMDTAEVVHRSAEYALPT